MHSLHFESLLRAGVIKWFVVTWFVLSATYIHFRGRVRHTLKRQFLDHSTIMAPYNVFVYARSAVPNLPILDRERFPQLNLLRDHWQTIRDEALHLWNRGEILFADNSQDLAFNTFQRTGWTRFHLKWYRDFLPSAVASCPRTVELLRQVPMVKSAMFAVLPPGARLGEHRDPFAGSLRYHLGLSTPNSEQCCIWVDGQQHVWQDGKDVVFDETYVHWARNESDQTRIILFADIERPLKDPVSRLLNRAFAFVAVAGAASRNLPDENLGLMNRLFTHIYAVRRFGMWLKQQNRKLYYVAKWTLFGALLYWLLL